MTQVSAAAGDPPNRLFSGFDSVANGMLTSISVEGKTLRENLGATLNIEVCRSTRELRETMAIDSTVSVSFLGTFKATAKMSFMNSLNITENNVTIVAYARKGIGIFKASDVALRPGVEPPTNKKAADFVRTRGDCFISAASYGGEYYGIYTFRTTTRQEQSSLIASLKANGISGSLKLDAEAQLKLTKFLRETETSSTFRQEMTGVTGIGLPKEAEMIDFAHNFSRLEMNSPALTDFSIEHYEKVPNFGRAFSKVRTNSRYFRGERGLLASLPRLRGMQDQIARLKAIYHVYGFDDPELDALGPKVADDIATIGEQVHAWEDNATGDFVRPELPSLARGEPELTFEVGQPASFGSETGPNFDFMRVGAALNDHVRIESIQLADGGWGPNDRYHVIRRLIVGYKSESKGKWTATHGQDGQPRGTLELEAGEFPSWLKIGHGGLIDSIAVKAGGRTIKAGGTNGTVEEWTPPKDAVVLGFAGRAGGALDQIRIVYATLKPARYRQPN